MATRPCKAWKTPDMIIMIAANMMNPTAAPLVCRPAREYASLLTADPSSASDDRPHHGTCGGMPTLPLLGCAVPEVSRRSVGRVPYRSDRGIGPNRDHHPMRRRLAGL